MDRDPFSTATRMGVMMFLVAFGGIIVTLLLVVAALDRNLDMVTRNSVLDDLQEYSAIYSAVNILSLGDMFGAGRHEGAYALRIESPSGEVLLAKANKLGRDWRWPVLPPGEDWGEEDIHVFPAIPPQKEKCYIGRLKLSDGNIVYYAKSDLAERQIFRDIVRQFNWAALMGIVLVILPILWFTRSVARPLEKFTADARAAAGGGTGVRLNAPGAVPELRRFAAAFNLGLDRIDTLVRALQSANDQIAHELRTPLARLKVRLESLAAREPGHAAVLGEAVGEIDRITRLLKTILDIRAGQSGVIALKPETVDLTVMLADIAELYRSSAELSGLRLFAELPLDGEPVLVSIDRERMFQVVANLLDNALKYTPSPGWVQVGLRRIKDVAEITVRDTGPGLPAGHDLWKPFHRGDHTDADMPGVGLGLSLVKMIVERHGGICKAANAEPHGALFTVRLPLFITKR
ncbi:MAG: HAMP domain-containing sensor histidine kinase [Candidatus Methylacidiphilales bacterium]|nr:HAMP domain-containing sensor histidine kinase [Candidatus Methylacidiphilales bacterium]